MGADTSSATSAAVSRSATVEYEITSLENSGETTENPQSEQKPPKLKLKLRNLAPMMADASGGNGSAATVNTPTGAFHTGDIVSGISVESSNQQEAPLRWTHTSPSIEPSTPPAKQVMRSGSFDNPIDVDKLKTPSPHKFLDRPSGYFAPLPLQYHPSRPKLAPKFFTPNGAAILSGDIPKPPGFTFVEPQIGPAVPQSRTYTAIPGTQRPRSHQPASLQTTYQPYPANVLQQISRAHNPYVTFYQTPTSGYPVFPKQDETLLRERTVQFMLDHSRPRPRKRRFSDDPYMTSSSEYENASTTTKRAHKGNRTPTKTPDLASTLNTGASEESMLDRNLKFTEMVQHAQLVTSLLMAYPYSTDQNRLREDITVLAAVMDERLEIWLSVENELDLETLKRQRTSSATTPMHSPRKSLAKRGARGVHASAQSEIIVLTEDKVRQQMLQQEKRKQEDELKRYLSAESDVWEKSIEESIRSGGIKSFANSVVAGSSNEGPLSSCLGRPDSAQEGDVQGPEQAGEEEQALAREQVSVASSEIGRTSGCHSSFI